MIRADHPFIHTAVYSSAILEPVYPEPEHPPQDAEWVIVRENGVCVRPGTPPGIFLSADERDAGCPVPRSHYLGHR